MVFTLPSLAEWLFFLLHCRYALFVDRTNVNLNIIGSRNECHTIVEYFWYPASCDGLRLQIEIEGEPHALIPVKIYGRPEAPDEGERVLG